MSVALNLCAIACLGLYRIDRNTHQRNLDALRDAGLAERGSV